MEPQTPTTDYRSSVDTSRPFSSVKEAIAIFGERILVGEIYSPKSYTFTPPKRENILSSKYSSSPESCQLNQNYPRHENHSQNYGPNVLDALRKLKAELENTKAELKVLKERESETEILLASLNAELHKNMSKLAEVEAEAAKKAVASFETSREEVIREEEMRKELMKRMENNQTLAHILSIGKEEGIFGGRRERKMKKKKPIVPLIGDFFKRKGSPTAFHSSLYESPDNVYFN
ncbi:hypothetical protein SLE2022_146220 [Rubroshorea leprosula]